ncbi:unnamed protein product [Schistocephalus solidus]|uniref:Pentatricopeptide repeat-containing protein n=1 Tax=Schistocephalus solidus TaxID=70667 RepID=A0A183SGQ8_SCHSO|nr:unnamed protein product [Schistocephalus solidus]
MAHSYITSLSTSPFLISGGLNVTLPLVEQLICRIRLTTFHPSMPWLYLQSNTLSISSHSIISEVSNHQKVFQLSKTFLDPDSKYVECHFSGLMRLIFEASEFLGFARNRYHYHLFNISETTILHLIRDAGATLQKAQELHL